MYDSSDTPTEYEVALATTPAPDLAEEEDCADERKARQETIVKLLQSLADAGTAENVGRKVLILCYELKLEGCRTLDDLADKFSSGGEVGVSRARVSQIVSSLNLQSGDFRD